MRLLTKINANLQRWPAAEKLPEIALQHRPKSTELRLRHAQLREQQGRHEDSLRELESPAAAAVDTPQLLVHLGRGLQFAGRNSEAVALLERGVRRWPTETALHKLLAQAYWQLGDGEDCTRELERAISSLLASCNCGWWRPTFSAMPGMRAKDSSCWNRAVTATPAGLLNRPISA